MSVLGKRIKLLREKNDYSQKRVADALGISNVQLSRYESGDRKPDPEMLALIADFYGVTVDYLLGRSDTPHMTADQEFIVFANDPELQRWYKELPQSDEEDIRRLRDVWEIMKRDGKEK